MSVSAAPTEDGLSVNDYLNKGLDRYEQYDYERATMYYTKALSLKPRDAKIYVLRGDAHRDNDEIKEAITDYTAAIRLNPRDAAPYYNRAMVRKIDGDLRGAIADYEKHLALCDGQCELDRAEIEQSIRDLRKQAR